MSSSAIDGPAWARTLAFALALVLVPAAGAIGPIDVPDLGSTNEAPSPSASPASPEDPAAPATLAAALGTDLGSTSEETAPLALAAPYDRCDPHPPIEIHEDHGTQGFTWTNPLTGRTEHRPGNGVVAGDGTAENPYTIAGWCITPDRSRGLAPLQATAAITIEDTSAHVLVRDTIVDGQPASGASLQPRTTGIAIEGAENVTVERVTVTVTDTAIAVDDAHRVHVDDNRIEANADGIAAEASARVHLTGNEIANEDAGIRLADTHRSEVAANTIAGHEVGLQLEEAEQARIANNTIADNEHGVLSLENVELELTGNTITGNAGGVDVRDSRGLRLANNTVTGNDHGVDLYRSMDSRLTNNTLTGNALGLRLANASDARVGFNDIHGNERAGLAAWTGTHGVDATRNWWGHASGPSGSLADPCTGTSLDGDGEQLSILDSTVCLDPWRRNPNPHAGAG